MSTTSEIRNSIISNLLEKTRKKSFKHYLLSIRLEKIRLFNQQQINFDFPVTALIGPNGGGKSTIIGATMQAYHNGKQNTFFKKSRVGDEGMNDWKIEFEIIDKEINKTGTERFEITYNNNEWTKNKYFSRTVKFMSITRTVPISENPLFQYRRRISFNKKSKESDDLTITKLEDISQIKHQAEKILGKSLENFTMYEFSFQKKKDYKTIKIPTGNKIIRGDGLEVPEMKKVQVPQTPIYEKQYLYVGSDGVNTYSEFNFGAGETSIIRLVAELESIDDNSLILIEELENGLHPIAIKRVVEYLIDIAKRKNLQIIFTTHSDYAIEPLPSEAIWACVEGNLQQGKLSIETLRVVSGRFDKKLAIFVEDDFAKNWLEYIIREKIAANFEEIGVYAVGGDGNAVKVHNGHNINPSISFQSICFIDGDSQQNESPENNIFRLPGLVPELAVFGDVLNNIENNIAMLTVACQKPISQQETVSKVIKEISKTNRDPHLLFSQIGIKLGFISAEIIRGAFLSIWTQENEHEVSKIVDAVNKNFER